MSEVLSESWRREMRATAENTQVIVERSRRNKSRTSRIPLDDIQVLAGALLALLDETGGPCRADPDATGHDWDVLVRGEGGWRGCRRGCGAEQFRRPKGATS